MPKIVCSTLASLAIACAAFADSSAESRTREFGVMGTDLKIEAFGSDGDALDTAIDLAVAELQRIEDMMTTWRDSPLTRLNATAGQEPQSVPPELHDIIGRGIELHRLTEGSFDITFHSAGRLWDFKADPPVIPSPEDIAQALPLIDASRIRLSETDAPTTVDLPEGMAIGLGGLAKGYGVDRAMDILREAGVEHAIVNAGGDMKVLGTRHGEPWEVAIKHPRHPEVPIAVLRISNQSVVTSGDYARFVEVDGKRYHHILDPRTGYPAEGCMSATVVTFNAEFADALATACCVLGPEDGLAMLTALPKVEGILVGLDGQVIATEGLRENLAVPVRD